MHAQRGLRCLSSLSTTITGYDAAYERFSVKSARKILNCDFLETATLELEKLAVSLTELYLAAHNPSLSALRMRIYTPRGDAISWRRFSSGRIGSGSNLPPKPSIAIPSSNEN